MTFNAERVADLTYGQAAELVKRGRQRYGSPERA
jgi:hypothetical protein